MNEFCDPIHFSLIFPRYTTVVYRALKNASRQRDIKSSIVVDVQKLYIYFSQTYLAFQFGIFED